MSATGPQSLADSLRRRIREDRALTERAVDEELRSFEAAWRRRSAAALNTIEADTLSQARRLSRSLRLAWLIPLIAGLGLTLGVFGGSWALTRHLSLEIRDLMLSAQEQRLTLESLEERTGGIVLRRRSEGTFLTVPPGRTLDPGWTLGGAPAWRLSED